MHPQVERRHGSSDVHSLMRNRPIVDLRQGCSERIRQIAVLQERMLDSFTRRISNSEAHLDLRSQLLVVCITIVSSYLVPTVVGMLVSNPQTVWPVWPGCAILVTGLLLVR